MPVLIIGYLGLISTEQVRTGPHNQEREVPGWDNLILFPAQLEKKYSKVIRIRTNNNNKKKKLGVASAVGILYYFFKSKKVPVGIITYQKIFILQNMDIYHINSSHLTDPSQPSRTQHLSYSNSFARVSQLRCCSSAWWFLLYVQQLRWDHTSI